MTDPATHASTQQPPSPATLSPVDRLIRSLTLALLLGAIASLALFPLHWALNLTIHMQAHLLAGAVLLAIAHLWRSSRAWAAVCVMLAAALSMNVRPWEFWIGGDEGVAQAADEEPEKGEQELVRLLFWNVHQNGVASDTLFQLASEHDVDVVTVLELGVKLRSELDALREAYPVHDELPRNDSFGLGVYSRLPGVIVRRRLNDEVSVMILRTAPDTGPWLDVWAVHLYPPVGEAMYRARNAQMVELAQRVTVDRSVPQVVGGDFNTTPWSLLFRGFLKATELKDSSLGFGYHATWPQLLGPFGIPIDHVAVDQRLRVVSRRVLRVGESDHAAVLVTLTSAETAP